ncbi:MULTISPECIES: prephenate dehydrogenase [unclassified Paracoccus (in: a-proteobacteria)]|uniref:prephenate dehydrogenase n=1 Tax=unclassified Paracoccus (in: a-proteobacteria) TaxID=2688777 RepID=UPI0021E1916D|nr:MULTISPECIES: prephenate dehydrogenase [unclassified Paracoccus (in: a-proteobacteria)]UXU76639.1 prephenate dehydrogenase [Paracoccus sp. SMMA_5]UXU82527.1 prephenate dehydrogenase [Paracoccus sp. SMMA_5_TC]
MFQPVVTPSAPLSPASVLIVGYGAFGRLLARMLAPHLPVAVCDPDPAARAAAAGQGLRVLEPQAAGGCDLVVLAVPVPALAQSLRQLAPHLRAGQTVCDVCSIKEAPVALMRRLLPACVDILGTHPLFGPQSLGRAPGPARVVLCPVRGGGWRRIAAFLRGGLELRVIVTTPEEHDRHAALTQGITHRLARAMAAFQPHPQIRTGSFDLLMQALAMVAADAPEVYEAVTRGNAHVAPLCDRFARLLTEG